MTISRFICLCIGALASIFIAATALVEPAMAAQTAPARLNFQGRLTDGAGSLMADGDYNMRFRAYLNEPTGGTPVWTETYDGSNRIEVKNGVFSVQLGGLVAMSPSAFGSFTWYIELELPTPGTATCPSCTISWTEGAMMPRQPIASHAYAMNADQVDGIDGANLSQLSASATYTDANIFRSSSNSTAAFQIQKSDGTPLLVADTQNLALKVGGGDVSPDGSPALLVFDYKNTYGDPAGTNGAIYYNSVTNTNRCYEAGAWVDCFHPEPSIREKFSYNQDFLAGVTLTPPDIFTPSNDVDLDATISMITAGNNSYLSSQPLEVNNPGIWRQNTGTTATGSSYITSPIIAGAISYPYRMGEGEWSFSANARITTVTDPVANAFGVYLGLSGTSLSNGCTLRYVYADYSGNWSGYCGNGTNSDKCDLGIAPTAGTWYNLKFTINSAATLATFTVNDTYTCTVPGTYAPTGSNMSLRFGIHKSAGTTARTVDIDYLNFSYKTSNR